MSKKIYLAIPFTGLEDLSFKCASEVAALLIKQEHYVFSPISHFYPIQKTELVEDNYGVWLRQDKIFVDWADEIYLVSIMGEGFPMDGEELIKNSNGCKVEINWAKEQNKPIKIVDYDFTHQVIYQIRDYDSN
jgi:hypothetical protein